ncbi:hypothetical protein MPL3365_140263 [Mesorhizobium plurifarium]|uniref:Uncharacterized protein n=1 Tax=Mesorhizobium plurifarium TaxID=69974 RepID=A0A090FY60_MESPL|nr:hypothetical protein MPL3365_140263 [Mesorhizobium plurifarium]
MSLPGRRRPCLHFHTSRIAYHRNPAAIAMFFLHGFDALRASTHAVPPSASLTRAEALHHVPDIR